MLLGNIYQAQAIRPTQQAAILELDSRIIDHSSWGAELVVVGGDFNVCLGPLIGYVGTKETKRADSGLLE